MSNELSFQHDEDAKTKVILNKLKDFLRIKVENRNEELTNQIALLIKEFSILPQYFSSSNLVGGQSNNQADQIDRILASQLEYFIVDSSFNIGQHGNISLQSDFRNDQSNAKKFKEFKEGDYFTFYDLEYSAEGSKAEISKFYQPTIMEQIKRKNASNYIEVGCLLLQEIKTAPVQQNLQKNQKIQAQNGFIQNYFDNIIKKEISLLKLNYSFLQTLSDNQIGQIPFNSNVMNFSQKEPVYLNNDDSDKAYIVRKGSFCVLWRDQKAVQQRQSIFQSHLQQESMQFRRWSLRVYEAKEIFGEEDIISDCRKRSFDIVCDSPYGQLIALPKNYFLYSLYPLLQNYFNNQIQNKEKLLSERINQIRSQQSKPYAVISPSLQSTQPISRECKENSLENSYHTIQYQQKQQSPSPASHSPVFFKKDECQSEQDLIEKKLDQQIKVQPESRQECIDSKKQLIQFLQNNRSANPQKNKEKQNQVNLSIQSKLNTKRKEPTNQQQENANLKKKSEIQRQLLKKKCQVKNINFQNFTNSLSCPQKEDCEYSQDSLNKFLELHISLTISSQHSSKINNLVNPITQSERLLQKQKNPANYSNPKQLQQQNDILSSQYQISPLLKNSNSMQNVIHSQVLQQKPEILITSSESPQKNYHHQQNASENFPQSSERRINKKTNSYNTLMKRQANRVSPPQADKALVLKTSSESASQGTNNSGGGINFLQALQNSNQNNHSNNNNRSNIQKFILNSNSSSSISIHSSRTSNNNQQILNSNGNTQDEIQLNNQRSPKNDKEGNQKQNEKTICSNSKLEQQNKPQHNQQQKQQSQSCYSNMVYSKIKEKEGLRKNLKKECSLLNKKGNINALSDYSFKLGNYKIKSELLSNSYQNLKELSSSKQEQMTKLRRKFSGDENITNNKPKYLFTPQFNFQNKFLKKSQGKFLLDKIVGGTQLINGLETKNPFLTSPLQKDVKVLLSDQQPPLIAMDRLILDQSQKPSITQRAAKIANNSYQTIQAHTPKNIQEAFQMDSSPNMQKSSPFLKQFDNLHFTSKINLEMQNQTSSSKQNKISNNSNIQPQNNQDNLNSAQKINKYSSGYQQLHQIVKYQYLKSNLNQSARNHYGKLKQLLSQSLASPANKNLSSQMISQNQQTFSQLFNNSNNQNFNNSTSQTAHQQQRQMNPTDQQLQQQQQ